MNYETRLLHRALNDRSLSPLLSKGVDEKWFNDEQDRRVWVFSKNHYTSYGECPSADVIKDNFPVLGGATITTN